MRSPFVQLILIIICSSLFFNACIPPAPPYPHEPPAKIVADGQRISDSLEAYIKRWMAGQAPAQIPASLIPKGITDSRNFYLKDPAQVTPEEIWATRAAHPINTDSVMGGLPDPNVTYLLLGPGLAPFGSKVVIEGEFPHCRFFSMQVTHPLDGKHYTATRYFGSAEVSVADADIEPLPGHVNPFQPGANRNATNRKYRFEIKLAAGDPVALNEGAFVPPYRKQNNWRAGSLLVYQGPWGEKDFFGNKKPDGGKWNVGNLWLRIYAPDKGTGALGGAALPKLWYELPDGRKYFIGANFDPLLERANLTMKARSTNTEPNKHYTPDMGWFKSWGIVRSILNGASIANGWERNANREKINAVDLGVTGRGENRPGIGQYEPHATTNNYATYLGRGITVQKEEVAVLVGRMPEFPATIQGNATMQKGQVRYWSICGYDNDPLAKIPGSAVNGIVDEEVKLQADRYYIIAYSRSQDRPQNATTANGVNWVNWGPTAELGLMMRWVTVGPEWDFSLSPHEGHLSWAKSDWAGSVYDSTLIGVNWHKGFMQCYLPRIVVMKKSEFEALGNNPQPRQIPSWIDKSNKTGISEAYKQAASASSVWKNEYRYRADMAFDGDLKTRWASKSGEKDAYLQVDLGTIKSISAVKLFWEFAAAKKYTIEASYDGNTWTTLYSTTSGNGGIDAIKNLNGRGRYVRMHATKGTLLNWYSLYEMEVLSNELLCANALPAVAPQAPAAALKIVPNPAISETMITSTQAGKTLAVFNAKGARIYAQTVSGLQQKLLVGSWLPGIYTVQWQGYEGMQAGRLVKL
jgi:hypothetical protein